MPILSGYLKRTSGKQQLLFKIIYIATILAALTLIRGKQDTNAAGSFSLPLCYLKNNSSTTLQPAALDCLRAAQVRQLET